MKTKTIITGYQPISSKTECQQPPSKTSSVATPPMPPVKPPCKHRIKLICDQDDLWEIYISDTLVCHAKTHGELMEKLVTLIEILD